MMAAGLLDGGVGSVLWRSWGWLVCGGKRWWKAEGFGQLRGKQKGVGGFRVQGMKAKNPKGEVAAGERERPGKKKMGLRCGGEKQIPAGGRLRLWFF